MCSTALTLKRVDVCTAVVLEAPDVASVRRLTFTVKSLAALVVETPVCTTVDRSAPEYTVQVTL